MFWMVILADYWCFVSCLFSCCMFCALRLAVIVTIECDLLIYC